MQEVAAYLGPTMLKEDEKMSSILYCRRHANTSESKPYCESLFNIERVFSTSREHVLCRWPCQEFATIGNFAALFQSCLLRA